MYDSESYLKDINYYNLFIYFNISSKEWSELKFNFFLKQKKLNLLVSKQTDSIFPNFNLPTRKLTLVISRSYRERIFEKKTSNTIDQITNSFFEKKLLFSYITVNNKFYSSVLIEKTYTLTKYDLFKQYITYFENSKFLFFSLIVSFFFKEVITYFINLFLFSSYSKLTYNLFLYL